MFKTLLRTLSALSIVTITASAGFAEDKTPASVTTDVWKKGFGSPDKQPSISPKEIDDIINNQFLAPNADWADNADGPAHGKIDLNFDTTDDNVVNPTTLGTAVFYRGHNASPNTYNHHAGILGNADLGAPLTETLGWVEWSGTIKAAGLYDIDKAFTLRVTFPGKIIAGIVRQRGDYHYKIDGNFNSKGVISGTVEYALFNTNAQGEFTSTAAGRVEGKLSGLIGENGALGVFHSRGGLSAGYAGYAGGFSATWDSRTHKGSLARCNSNTGDPFADNCESDGFKEHRELRLDYCITGGNAQTDPRKCHNATIFSSCVIDPFHSTCNEDNFPDLMKARLNRAEFCNNSANDANVRRTLCTETHIVTGICTDDPFNTICGTDYGPARISRCRTSLEANDCTATIVRVCSDDPFDPFCVADYGSKRLEFCREGKQKNNSCTAHVPVICGDNPFNALCEASSYDDARLEFCRDGRQKKDSDCSTNLVSMICGDNPFNTLCEADYGVARVNLIKRCVGNSGDPTCMGAISTIDKCETNPFTDTQFCRLDVFETAREELVKSCFGNRSDTTCAGAISTITNCESNPFTDTSFCRLDVFENRRVTLIDRCYADADGEGCGVITPIITACNANVFGANCYFDVFKAARQALLKACKDPSVCTDSVKASRLTQPNAATWRKTLKTRAENPIVLGNGRGTISPENQFLKNIESAEGNRSIKIYITPDDYSNPGTTYRSLNLKTAEFNIDGSSVSLGGDEEDGMAYFQGSPNGQSKIYTYAGIYSTTDLGAPVNDKTGTASWVGSFYAFYSDLLNDFVLEVNFDTKSIEAFVGSQHLKGDYDDNGVINGTVIIDSFNNRYEPGYHWIRGGATLTGLIGKEGAVGVFIRNEYSIIYSNYRGGFVARPAADVPGAVSFLNETCAGNPFHKFCYLRQEARKTAIDKCITDKDVLNDNCEKAREYHSCLRHPFDRKCKTALPYHNVEEDEPYYQIVRANRSAFCKETANKNDDFCTDAERVALCSYDPFHTLCDNTNGIYNKARKAVCKANSNHTGCNNTYETSSNVTEISWLSGLYKDNGVVPMTQPDTLRLRQRHQFLQSIENWLNTRGARDYLRNVVVLETLNLNTATFDGLKLGGIATGGVVFVKDNRLNSYAGILSGTDLGAPVTETSGTAKWYGNFQIDHFRTDFTLDITFGAEGKDGSVEAFVHYGGNDNTDYILLKGKFDVNGVISGTVDSGIFVNHDQTVSDISYNAGLTGLTGLIGAEGAVGAFIGIDFSGGFVAVPKKYAPLDSNVKSSDWRRSFGNTPRLPIRGLYNETRQTRFLLGRRTGLSTDYLSGIVRPANPLTLADVNAGGEVADGVGYVSGTQGKDYNSQTYSYDTITTHHYAGILFSTDLGAVLDRSVVADWKGKLGMIVDAVEVAPRDITLNINFSRKGIEIADTKTDDDTHFVNFDNLSWDTNGVITGEINYNPGDALDNFDIDSTRNSPGIVRGLIGQQGAVGAFISNHGDNHTNENTPYAGGFVAVPSAVYVQTVSFSDWVSSFPHPYSQPLPTMVPYSDRQQTRFLQGTRTGLSTDYLSDVVRSDLPLTLADVRTDGEVADGVAYMSGNKFRYNFQIRRSETKTHHYAGILSGTYLGAPLEVIPADANGDAILHWEGKLGMIVNGASPVESSITLDVNYTEKNITLNRTAIGQGAVYFSGVRWDEHGVLAGGTMTYDPNDSALADSAGIVTGLIGQQGAVGAFISDGIGDIGYSGGFVAVPSDVYVQTVGFSDWISSFGNTSSSLLTDVPPYEDIVQTRFLQGTEIGLYQYPLSNVVRPPNPLTLADGDLGGQSADGVDYLSGTYSRYNHATRRYETKTKRHYAGILSGTYLGAPLDAPVTAKWRGKLGMVVDEVDVPLRDITLNINFTNTVRNITIADTKTTSNTHFVNFNNLSSDENGVITGEITYDATPTLQTDGSYAASDGSTGKVTGLIGQQGAVGAFISNHDNPSSKATYAGGFVGVPPAEPASP